ncbi:MAG: hypothetical protein H5U38_06915 [Calditrichaeota bacterium]|nr:hypothetical protein [Calditrichota bacterium]
MRVRLFQLLALTSAFAVGLSQTSAQTAVTVAVLEFQNVSGIKDWDRLCALVPEMLKTELSRSPYLQVLERSTLDGVMQELALAQSGLLNEEQALAVGQMAGARYVIQGAIGRSAGALRLDAHIVEVSSGRVLGEKVEGHGYQALPQMVGLLAQNIVYDLTGNGQYQQQVRLRTYPASFALGVTGVCGLATLITHLNYREAYHEYQQATRLADFDRTYDRANSYMKARNVLLGVTGVAGMVTLALIAANRTESNYVVAAAAEPRTNRLSLRPEWDGAGVRLALSYRW